MTDPEDEILYRLQSIFDQMLIPVFAQMFDRLDNAEARMCTIEKDFAKYCDHNPKMEEQWAEERLNALDTQMPIVDSNGETIKNGDILLQDINYHAGECVPISEHLVKEKNGDLYITICGRDIDLKDFIRPKDYQVNIKK